jgi:hypothetical protein
MFVASIKGAVKTQSFDRFRGQLDHRRLIWVTALNGMYSVNGSFMWSYPGLIPSSSKKVHMFDLTLEID